VQHVLPSGFVRIRQWLSREPLSDRATPPRPALTPTVLSQIAAERVQPTAEHFTRLAHRADASITAGVYIRA
jgi:hypothetical protein